MKNKILFTFDNNKKTVDFIFRAFPKLKKECIFCGKKITNKNIGAVVKKGFTCSNICCLVDFVKNYGKKNM